MLLLNAVMPQLVQVVCLDLKVLFDLVRLELQLTLILTLALNLSFHALLFASKLGLLLFFVAVQSFYCSVSLLNESSDFVYQLFSANDNFVVQLQLMTISELKVALDAHWVHLTISF